MLASLLVPRVGVDLSDSLLSPLDRAVQWNVLGVLPADDSDLGAGLVRLVVV